MRTATARGFTLIEVLVAIMIMVGAVLIVGNSWSGNYLRVRKTQLYLNVAELLERKAVEIETKYRDASILEITDESGDFGKDFPQYRWTFTVQPFEMPDMTAALTSQGSGANEMALSILSTMQQMISKAVLEGVVTVYVKSKNKEVPFSVTMYFVDYKAELAMPGAAGAATGGG